MGRALLKGWFSNNIVQKVSILDPLVKEIPQNFREFQEINLYNSVNEFPIKFSPSMVVLAVKPQVMKEALLKLVVLKDEKTKLKLASPPDHPLDSPIGNPSVPAIWSI